MLSSRRTGGRGPGTIATLVLGVIVVACGTPVAATPSPESSAALGLPRGTVTLTEDGCEYDGPAEVASGPMVIAMVNATSGQFDLDLWRMDEGHTYDELTAHIAEEMRRQEAGEPPLGHPTFAELVGEATVEESAEGEPQMVLEPGTYGMACILFPAPEVLGAIFAAGPFIAS